MENRIAVLGGSFNPPTVAHRRLLEAAVDAVDAGCGMFLPSAYWYVERKLKKQGCRQDALSDRLRLDMLRSMCETDGRLMVSALEIDRAKRSVDIIMKGFLLFSGNIRRVKFILLQAVTSCMLFRDGTG